MNAGMLDRSVTLVFCQADLSSYVCDKCERAVSSQGNDRGTSRLRPLERQDPPRRRAEREPFAALSRR